MLSFLKQKSQLMLNLPISKLEIQKSIVLSSTVTISDISLIPLQYEFAVKDPYQYKFVQILSSHILWTIGRRIIECVKFNRVYICVYIYMVIYILCVCVYINISVS